MLTISLQEHFRLAHNHTIRPRSLGVRFSRDGDFPIGVCFTIQQLFKVRSRGFSSVDLSAETLIEHQNRASPDIVREALAFSPPNPKDRNSAIQAAWQQLQYDHSPFLLGAGITVSPQPVQVNGRQLEPLPIGFHKDTHNPQVSRTFHVLPGY